MRGQEPLGLSKLQLSSGKYAEGNNPAQCWRLSQVGELLDVLSLANAPGSVLCYTPHLRAPSFHAGLDARRHMPGAVPWPCCQPGPSPQTAAALAWLAGGINPCREIIIGDGGDSRGLPVRPALSFPPVTFSSPAKILFAVGSA